MGMADGGALQRPRANRKIRGYTSENVPFFFARERVLFLEFQIAVTARLAVFLSINYTGIVTLRIMEREVTAALRW